MPDPSSDIQQPNAPGMQSELEAMSDPSKAAAAQAAKINATRDAAVRANAAQGLQAATGGGGNVPPPLSDQIAMHLMKDTEIDPDRPQDYIKAAQKRIKEMTDLASDAKQSGNVGAYNTYQQVASVLQQHLGMLHEKYTAHLQQIAARAVAEQNAQVQAQNESLGYDTKEPLTDRVGPSTRQPLRTLTEKP